MDPSSNLLNNKSELKSLSNSQNNTETLEQQRNDLEILNGIPTKIKVIEYKGKQKRIPAQNEDETLCEHFIIRKMRYCHFKKVFSDELKGKNKDKNLNGDYCVYHQPVEENPENEFILCPIDPRHSISKAKLNKHIKKCNFLRQQEKVTKNIWYKKDANVCHSSLALIQNHNLTQGLETLYENSLWENLSEQKYESLLDKIISAYEKLKNEYSEYSKQEKIQKLILQNNVKLSALQVDLDTDLLCTAQLPKAEKMQMQNEAIAQLLQKFEVFGAKEKCEKNLEEDNKPTVFIEFGAGKAGLSHFINSYTENKSMHYLLERGSNRFKKDRHSQKLVRFKTDIKDFDIDYLNEDIKSRNLTDSYVKNNINHENNEQNISNNNQNENAEKPENKNYSLLGIAKHICGCALDLSLTCLLNFQDKSKVKGFCLATCCHNICRLEYLNNLSLFTEKLGFDLEEVVYLFKATSWLFGSIDPDKALKLKEIQRQKNENANEEEDEENSEEDLDVEEELNRLKEIENDDKKNSNLNSKLIFERKKLRKEYIGLISKYVIDLSRVSFLIEKGFDVLYIKYCGNEITTENNLILALRE